MVTTLPAPTTRQDTQTFATNVDQLALIVARLEKGWDMFEGGHGSAEEIARWEDSWLRMLRQYEALIDAA